TRDGSVFASNTSTIPITRIAEAARRPGQVIGMHFFSPVARMPLLEVIAGARSAPAAVSTAVAFGRRLGKTVIVVKDSPGFWVNRILAPYMNEAAHLLLQGVAMEEIDRLMTQWGFPVGPITLLDEVGLDIAAKAAGVLHAAFGERLAPPSWSGSPGSTGRASLPAKCYKSRPAGTAGSIPEVIRAGGVDGPLSEDTLGGYQAAHQRPPAFGGSDGFAYSVAASADEGPG